MIPCLKLLLKLYTNSEIVEKLPIITNIYTTVNIRNIWFQLSKTVISIVTVKNTYVFFCPRYIVILVNFVDQ